MNVKFDQFTPAPQFKTLYFAYLLLSVIFFILPWYLPVAIFAPLIVTFIFTLIVLSIVILVLYWIPRYYPTIHYHFTDTEIEWRRGVWFKKTGIVPYNRITNIDVEQGPLSRMLKIASLKIQTAGYSAPSGAGGTSEIRIEGVEPYEELRQYVMGFVRGKKPVATETYEEGSAILEELVKIRKLLEKPREK